MDTVARNIVQSMTKLGKMHQRMIDACDEEIHSIAKAKA